MIKGLANHIKSYPKGSVQDLEKDFATSLIKMGWLNLSKSQNAELRQVLNSKKQLRDKCIKSPHSQRKNR